MVERLRPARLAELLDDAMTGPTAENEVTDEQLAAVAGGRLTDIAAADRQRVLLAISRDAVASRTVAELARLERAEINNVDRPYVIFSFARPVAALAACLLLSLLGWKAIDPSFTRSEISGQITVQKAERGDSYWDQYDRQQLERRARVEGWRDAALVGSGACTSVFLLAWIVGAARRRRGQKLTTG